MNSLDERESLYCWLNKDKIVMPCIEVDYEEKLRNKKLKLKSEYLQLELEETQWVFHQNLIEFQNEF